MYVLGDVVSIRAFENLIENYLAIKNSSRNELDVTDYSEIDIEEKIRMIEIKNNKKVIPNEFIVISFDHLSNDDKKRIINDIIDNVLKELDDEEKKIVPEEEIYSFFMENIESFDNTRIIKSKIKNAFSKELIRDIIQ